jgi:hypothetical protein
MSKDSTLSLSLRSKIEAANAKALLQSGKAIRTKSTRKRVYIAGKVGDLTDDDYYFEVVRKFAQRQRELRKLGYSTVNPMEIVSRGTSWEDAMKICIRALTLCDFISPLADVNESAGGCIEMDLCAHLRIPVIFPSRMNRKM